MDWKKLKKDNISLDYTIMLLPHSQKQPIHFKIPVWGFGAIFLFLLILVGTTLFFAGSSHQLRKVQQEKQQVEMERQQLASQKQQMEMENSTLKQVNLDLGTELRGLEEKTSSTLKELEDLYERENEIRDKVGLDNLETMAEDPPATITNALPPLSLSPQFGEEKLGIVKNNLDMLQFSVAEQSKNYDLLSAEIDSVKTAAAVRANKKIMLRNSVVNYALQFVGNKYVYGGNDPNTGADCSGFTKYVLIHSAGVSLNRTSTSQASQGKKISQSEAKPGDLIFYGNGSSINHVAIYIGNGQIVHASSAKTGIKVSNWNYRTPVKIINVLD